MGGAAITGEEAAASRNAVTTKQTTMRFFIFCNSAWETMATVSHSPLAPSSSWTAGGWPILLDFEIFGRGYAQQVLNKIIPTPTNQIVRVIAAFTVKHVGYKEHVKALVGAHQSVNEAHAFNRVHIIVNVTMLHEQMPLQPVRHGDVGLCRIVVLQRISLIQLVPPGFVQP